MRDGPGSAPSREGPPWPEGDADALASAARSVASAGKSLGSLASALGTSASGSAGWRGSAATAFQDTIETERVGMQRSAEGLAQATAGLRRLSEAVTAGQAEVRRLASEAQDAEAAADAAQARAAMADALAAGSDVLALAARSDPAVRAAEHQTDVAAAHAERCGPRRAHADEVRARATRRAEHLCEDLSRVDVATARALERAAALAPLGGRRTPALRRRRMRSGAPLFYGLSRSDAHQLAYFLAGISHWDPSEGLVANNVRAVYAFYGKLWSADHDLRWAGMANLVGPLFYAGWQDLYLLRSMSDGGNRLKYLTRMMGLPRMPGIAYGAADVAQDLTPAGVLADVGSDELEWFEHRFLDMQKQIFDDVAWKHAAYSLGGIELLRDMRADGQLRENDLRPFEDIASGLPERVAAGNKALLLREQQRIIQNDYDAIRSHHGPVGAAFSEALTWTATALRR